MYKSKFEHPVKMFFLTFILTLCHIHDVGDFLSPRKQGFK